MGTIKLAVMPLAVAVLAATAAGAFALPTMDDGKRTQQITSDRDSLIVAQEKKKKQQKKKRPGRRPAQERRGS
jgi:hypothetical protein